MKIVYLFLAFISATYAVPITNENPQLPGSNNATIAVEPLVFRNATVEPRSNRVVDAFVVIGTVAFNAAHRVAAFVVESLSGNKIDKDIRQTPEYSTFMKEAQRLHATLIPSVRFVADTARVNSPVHYKIIVVGGSPITGELMLGGEAAEKLLSEVSRGVFKEDSQKGELRRVDAKLKIYGAQVSSEFDAPVKPGEEPVRCPCILWYYHSKSGDVWGLYVSHESGRMAMADGIHRL
ncbi:hypothetical protein C8R42DRAFT_47408 [Lentinula raphanica]|nr:hypothetical protein C8R42DRAFT_47408 [Lentinula raphanica]